MLRASSSEDYETVHRSVCRIRAASQEIKWILEEHERSHHCGGGHAAGAMKQVG